MKNVKKSLQLLPLLFLVATSGYTLPLKWSDDSNWSAMYALRSSLMNGYVDENGNIKDPSIKIIETIPQGKRYGICHNYAISELLGLKGRIHETFGIPGGHDWYEEFNFLEDYCEEVSTPQKDDLVIYRRSKESKSNNLHTGIVHDEGIVRGKWANMQPPAILVHPTFTLPLAWGDEVTYYRIVKPKAEIIEDMKRKTANYHARKFTQANENYWLTLDAKVSDTNAVTDALDRNMAGSVDAANTKNQTLLMIAAKKKNPDLVKALLNYGADIDKQDIKGNTALMFAEKKDSPEIKEILEKHLKKTESEDSTLS